MREPRRRRTVPLVAATALALGFLAYWAASRSSTDLAAAVIVLGALIALAANFARPVGWAAAWTQRRSEGAVLAFAGASIIALAHAARVRHADLRFMDPEQLPPALWLVAAVLLLAGVWRLLDVGEGPSCAVCGAPATSAQCIRCGNELSPV